MSLGAPEIAIIVVIILVLFVGVKVFGDKRYLKRSGRGAAAPKDNNQKPA